MPAARWPYRGQSPAEILTDLGRFTEDILASEFVTMVAAVFDQTARSLTYSSAGHPPAFLRRAATGLVTQLIEANGPVLGPMKSARYEDCTIDVSPRDVLMMYTDGLVERPGVVVTDGISHAAELVAALPAEALLDCKAVADHIAPPPRSDDVCVLTVRFD